MKNYQNIYILCLFFYFNVINSQELALPKNIQSPVATSLGEFGDVGVSYYTGSPNIKIPLYNIKNYDIPLDIYLSYNSKGVRVNDMPGWVGQNWSLQSGGLVTRMVKGRVSDEYYVPSSGYALGDFYGFLHPESRSLLNVSNWNDSSYMEYLWSMMRFNGNVNNQKNREYGPDIFTFNFMGYTGKFFMGEDGEWKVSSNSNIKVIIEQSDNRFPFNESRVPFNLEIDIPHRKSDASKQIYKITLIDDNGINYIFGNTDSSIEYSVPFHVSIPARWTANSWYLTEVRDRFGKQIYSFEYEREDYIASFYHFKNFNVFKAVDSGSDPFDYSCFYSGGQYFSYNGDLISAVYLSKLKTLDGDIDFEREKSKGLNYLSDSNMYHIIKGVNNQFMNNDNRYHYGYLLPYSNHEDIIPKLDNWQKLTKISGLGKTVNLEYNDSSAIPADNDRLNLEKVSFWDKEFRLEYEGFSELPDLLSTAVDHWGYFDGTPWVYSYTNLNSHFNSRRTHSLNVKKGMLKKIVYPTQGYTEFEWEANSFNRYVSDDKSSLMSTPNTLAGGVRIKLIKDHDGSQYNNIREFKYVKDYDIDSSSSFQSGIAENLPKHYWLDFATNASNEPNYTLYEDIFSTNPILPVSNQLGYHIGYSEVVEIFQNGAFNIYEYTANDLSEYRDEFMPIASHPTPSPYTNFNDRSMLRGKLKKLTYFNSEADEVKKIENTYDLSNSNFVKSVFVSFKGCHNNPGVGFLKADVQKIFYFNHNKIKTKNFSKDGDNQLISYTEYEYEDFPNPIQTIGSQFLRSKKINIYGFDNSPLEQFYLEEYTYTFDKNNSIYNELVDQNKMALIQTDIRKNNNNLESSSIDFKINEGIILPWKYYNTKIPHLETTTFVIDSYNNKQLIERAHKPGGAHFYYAYDGDKLAFEVKGPNHETFNFLLSKLNSTINNKNLNINLRAEAVRSVIDFYPNHSITGYTYNQRGLISSKTDPNGITQFYDYRWDKLINIKDNDNNIVEQFIYNIKSN
ncbi:hypothetical protein [Psychroflexus tropicus]|uniref:hypothetical protein n=1 Tax=Psychroflexus tropicus TaxID=197345 RepID=UPI00035EACE9|nr:hypothetical protein [Psychroflexus tropicus]